MAASNAGYDKRPPSIRRKDMTWRLSLDVNGLNHVGNKQCRSQWDVFSAKTPPSDMKLSPRHPLYEASSFPPLTRKLLCEAVGENGQTPQCDPRNGKRSEGVKPVLNNGMFGVYGAICFQHPMPLHAGNVASLPSNSFHTHVCSPHLLFPVNLDVRHCVSATEAIAVPTLSHFEVQCCCSQSKSSQGSKHDEADYHVSKTADIASNVSGYVMTADALDIDIEEACNDGDEILGSSNAIHGLCDNIHANNDTGSEYYSDSDSKDCEDLVGDPSVDSCDLPHSNYSTPTESLITQCGRAVEHLTVSDNKFRLKKLLSDESGYYDSACSDVPNSPSDQVLKCDLIMGCEDSDEWDEDESADEADESADSLWKSFEDCMLSPHLLGMPTTKTRKTPQSPEVTAVVNANTKCKDMMKPQPQIPMECSEVTVVVMESQPEVASLADVDLQTTDVIMHFDPVLDKTNTCHLTTATCQCAGSRKQVHFPDDSHIISEVHVIVVWNYAYRAARRGPWEQCARDRAHFKRRIDNLASVLEPCLAKKMADIHSN